MTGWMRAGGGALPTLWHSQPSPAQLPPAHDLPAESQVAEVLREILAGPEFEVMQQPVGEQVLGWALRMLGRALDWLFELVGGNADLSRLLAVLAVAAAAIVAIMATARYAHRVSRLQPTDDDDGADAPRSAGEWLRLAAARADRGEFRTAATALYRGFLLVQDGLGALSFHRSKTPGDYALETGPGGDAARFIESFEDFSFGRSEATATGYAHLEQMAREAGCWADL